MPTAFDSALVAAARKKISDEIAEKADNILNNWIPENGYKEAVGYLKGLRYSLLAMEGAEKELSSPPQERKRA